MATKYIRRALFLGDERGVTNFPVLDATDIAAGDLVYYDSTGPGIVPFSSLSDNGVKAQNQAAAIRTAIGTDPTSGFVGVALKTHAAGSGATTIPVATRGVFEFDISSTTVILGALIGSAGTGTGGNVGLSNTAVEVVTVPHCAIGRAYKNYASATTRVQVEITPQFLGPCYNDDKDFFAPKTNSIAAAGSAQGDAAAIPTGASFTLVTGADGTKGVILPVPVMDGQVILVYSTVATNGLKIYPPSGGAINGGTGDAAITIEGKTLALFAASSAGNWTAIYTANS